MTTLLVACALGAKPDHALAALPDDASSDPAITKPVNIEFSIGAVSLHPEFSLEGIVVSCDRLRFEKGAIACPRAVMRIGDSPYGPIRAAASLRWSAGTGAVELETDDIAIFGGRVTVSIRDGPEHTRVSMNLTNIEIDQMAGALSPIMPAIREYEVGGGRLNAEVDCALSGAMPQACRVGGAVEQLSIGGTNVAEDLSADFEVDYAATPRSTEVSVSAVLNRGALYAEPGFSIQGFQPGFLLEVKDRPLSGSLTLVMRPDDEIVLRSLQISHPGIAELTIDGVVTIAPSFDFSEVEARLQSDDLARLYAVYLQPLLLGSMLGSLEIVGSATLELSGADGEISKLVSEFRDVYLEDEQGRFALFGLDGEFELHDGPEARESQIAWQAASFYRVDLGPGRIDLSSRDRSLRTVSWQDLKVFDGEFKIDTLSIERFGSPDMSIIASGQLTPISLSELTTALGWPLLAGRLSGIIPEVRLTRDQLEIDGALEVSVFDGTIAIVNLTVTDLFGVVPSLYADVDVDRLNLTELTSTFSFGNIEGRLQGRVEDLRLEAWQPVYFDAFFQTPPDDDSRHRISRQAVDNLGRLGAGTGTSLTQGLLGFIPSYSYGRLGIGCRLDGGFCEMSGVEPAADGGFYILTRGGLLPPWIDIKGSGRRVSWRTLVDGVRQIAQGKWEFKFGGRRD